MRERKYNLKELQSLLDWPAVGWETESHWHVFTNHISHGRVISAHIAVSNGARIIREVEFTRADGSTYVEMVSVVL